MHRWLIRVATALRPHFFSDLGAMATSEHVEGFASVVKNGAVYPLGADLSIPMLKKSLRLAAHLHRMLILCLEGKNENHVR